MSKLKILVLVLSCICIAPFQTKAGEFDGSRPLLGAVIELHECAVDNDCEEVTIEEINFVRFLEFNFKNKQITGTRANGQGLATEIKSQVSMNGMLILQGVENGRGWTITISEATGKMALTVSGDEEGFVVFGACIPR
jgi:hypothetical protein